MYMYCQNCGKLIEDDASYCPYCGISVKNQSSIKLKSEQVINNSDSGSFGWFILGFFLPIVGLILFIIWNNDKPKSAKKAGLGALISFSINLIITFIRIIIVLTR